MLEPTIVIHHCRFFTALPDAHGTQHATALHPRHVHTCSSRYRDDTASCVSSSSAAGGCAPPSPQPRTFAAAATPAARHRTMGMHSSLRAVIDTESVARMWSY